MQVTAFLHFHFREEHGGSYSGDGDAAAFRAADTVEDVLLVARPFEHNGSVTKS